MKTRWLLSGILLMATWAAHADLPLPKDRLQMPAIIMGKTPAHWVRLHRLSQRSPQPLLAVLEDYVRARESGEVAPVLMCEHDAPHSLAMGRVYALHRLGDIAGEEVIPALQKFIDKRLEDGSLVSWIDVITTQLTIERIRVRQAGRAAYIAEMVRWLRGEFTPTRHEATIPKPLPGQLVDPLMLRATDHWEGMFRMREAIRALGVLRAREALPVLLDMQQWGRFPDPPDGRNSLLAEALARIGDERALDQLEQCLRKWSGDAGPLEPGQVDPAWAYWHMRTRGLNLEQTVSVMVSALARDDHLGTRTGVPDILAVLGRLVVPYLVKWLQQPPGPNTDNALFGIINALGKMRAAEAVTPLRQLLRQSPSAFVRREIAWALGRIGDPSTIPNLASLAQDEERGVRVFAVGALGEMRHPEAISVLLKLLRKHPDEFTRGDAARELGWSGMRWLIPILRYQQMVEPSTLVRDELEYAVALLRKRQ